MQYSEAFIEYSNDKQDVCKNIEEFNPGKKRKVLIVCDDMIADMISNKTFNPIVSELYIRSRKLNISLFLLRNHILKHHTKLHLLFYYKHSKQKRASANCNKSFMGY